MMLFNLVNGNVKRNIKLLQAGSLGPGVNVKLPAVVHAS